MSNYRIVRKSNVSVEITCALMHVWSFTPLYLDCSRLDRIAAPHRLCVYPAIHTFCIPYSTMWFQIISEHKFATLTRLAMNLILYVWNHLHFECALYCIGIVQLCKRCATSWHWHRRTGQVIIAGNIWMDLSRGACNKWDEIWMPFKWT